MKYLLSILSILLFGLYLLAEDTDLRFSLMGEADAAISKGEWNVAERRLLEALEVSPDDPTNILLLSNLGMVRFNMGKDSLALETLNQAADIAPSSVVVLTNRATVRTALGDIAGAAADYSRVIDIDSTLVSPRFYLAVMALAEADTVTARNHAAHIVAIDSECFEAAFILARIYTEEGRHDLALPYYNKVIKLDGQPEYYAARALCYLHLDELNAAADDIASGLALDSEIAELYLYRAILNKMRFRPDDAAVDARRAVELGLNKSLVESTLGQKITN